MNLTDLITNLRNEAKKTEETASYLRIAADMIEHLQEERTTLVTANTNLQKALLKLEDKICTCQSQSSHITEEGQCDQCLLNKVCQLSGLAVYKLGVKKCQMYKGAKG